RRRHTRSLRDWSSDVCSSDLPASYPKRRPPRERSLPSSKVTTGCDQLRSSRKTNGNTCTSSGAREPARRHFWPILLIRTRSIGRSEERRVGKECRRPWEAEQI